jgi:hypothetical protein
MRPEEFKHAGRLSLSPSIPRPAPSGERSDDAPGNFKITDDRGGWTVRVVPNKFSALTPEGVT